MNTAKDQSVLSVVTLEGDGIGAEIMAAARSVLDAAVEKSFHNQRRIHWQPYPAGSRAFTELGQPLPDQTVEAIRVNRLALKGPLTTPVGGGMQSLNVLLRHQLDLYVCQRPVRSIPTLPSPLAIFKPIDVVIFRENSEDLYTGIEFAAGSVENARLLAILSKEFPTAFERLPFKQDVGIGIKPISRQASQRITRAAFQWALHNKRKKLTLVHKGNIMKYTEGAFLNWAYDVAEQEFAKQCFTQRRFLEIQKASGTAEAQVERACAEQAGMIMVHDVIADVAFEQAILQPQSFDVLVTTNLNGDYLSDAFAALAGGVGISPGANINPELGLGVFEANHGSADEIAGQDKANPCSLILSGAMLLDFAGWSAAADLVRAGVQRAIADRKVTFDLTRLIPDAQVVGTCKFTQQIIALM